MIRIRLAMLGPENTDLWWTVTPETASDSIAKVIVQLWVRHGNQWIDMNTSIEKALSEEKHILGAPNILGMYYVAKSRAETQNAFKRLLQEYPKASAIICKTAERLGLTTDK